jgi:hypothetical protein
MLNFEIVFTVATVLFVGWISSMMNDLYIKNLQQENRIIRLSYNLQLAEYRSGYPYYSGISMKPMSYETPLLEIYKHADEKLQRKRAYSM